MAWVTSTPVVGQQRGELRSASVTGCGLEQLDDPAPAARRGRVVRSPARSSMLLQQPGEQRLLGVQPVLGLVPDGALRPVDDLGGDLLAAVGRQAVQDDGVVGGPAERGLVDGVRAGTARCAVARTRPPAPSTPRCRWPARRRRRRRPRGSAVQRDRAAGLGGDLARPGPGRRGRAGTPRASRSARACRPSRRRAGRSAPCCWRRRRGRSASARPASPCARATVCRSARIWHGWNSSVSALTTGTRLTDGHGLDPVLAEGAPDDRGALPVQHPGGVLDRLAAAELAAAGVDDQRVAAELGDADREGHPGAGRRLVEQHGDRPRARPAASAPRRCAGRPSARRPGEHLGLLGRG